MPGGDRTGPFGQGPLTGRGAGFCGGFGGPGYAGGFRRGFGGGRGAGMGRGMGYGRRGWGPPYAGEAPYEVPYPTESEAQMLHREAKRLESALETIKERLEKLEEQPPKDSK